MQRYEEIPAWRNFFCSQLRNRSATPCISRMLYPNISCTAPGLHVRMKGAAAPLRGQKWPHPPQSRPPLGTTRCLQAPYTAREKAGKNTGIFPKKAKNRQSATRWKTAFCKHPLLPLFFLSSASPGGGWRKGRETDGARYGFFFVSLHPKPRRQKKEKLKFNLYILPLLNLIYPNPRLSPARNFCLAKISPLHSYENQWYMYIFKKNPIFSVTFFLFLQLII